MTLNISYLVQSNGLKIAGDTEHCLAHRYHKTSVHHKLRQLRTSLVRIPPMPNKKLCKMAELLDREIGRERGLSSFLTDDTNAHVCGLNHRHVVSTVSNTTDALLGELADQTGNVSLLGRRATARNHGRKLNSKGDKLVPIVLEENGQRFAINKKATIRLVTKIL